MPWLRTLSIHLPLLLLPLSAAAQTPAPPATPDAATTVMAEPEPAEPTADEPPSAQAAPEAAAGEAAASAAVPAAPAPAGDAAAPAAPAPDLAAEEAAIAAELAAMQPPPPPGPPPAQPAAQPAAAPQPASNALNPQISANGLILGGGRSEEARRAGDLETGFHLQEVELRFTANVDPYFRADLTLAAHADEIGFEEAYLSTLEIPQLTIRAGQIAAAIGRHNTLHTHAFPFLTAPHAWRELLGEEPLRAPGVSLDLLLPLPFYSELQVQVFGADWRPFQSAPADDHDHAADEDADAAGGDAVDAMADAAADAVAEEGIPDLREAHDFVYVAHLTTLLELGEDSTVELGGSYAAGRNGFGQRSDVVGADLTFKWRPLAAERYTGLDWSSEYLWVQRRGAEHDDRRGGAFSGLRFQFHQRFWAQARGGLLGLPEDDTPRSYRAEALLAFIPSEFSGLRLQYAYETSEDDALPDVHEVFLQALFSIGPHAPHDY